jgi:hypothetical protein
MVKTLCRRHKVRTEAREEIIEDGEYRGLPAKLRRKRTINGNGRAYGEDSNAEVVELLPPVFPGDRREGFRVLQRVLDIVVRYMQISRILVGHSGLVFGNTLGLRHGWYEIRSGVRVTRGLLYKSKYLCPRFKCCSNHMLGKSSRARTRRSTPMRTLGKRSSEH